jgi:hypothetical protein
MTAIRAFGAGLWQVLRAPHLVVVVSVVTLAAMVPFALTLGDRLREALGQQPPINLDAEEIDAEWWLEYRSRARGLEATFTPAIIGFTAPLDNLSALADGAPRRWALLGPLALYGLVWAFLAGGLLRRLDDGRRVGVRAFVRAGLTYLPSFAVVSLAAALVAGLLYLTVHALLLGPVYEWGAARAGSERTAFVWRVSLYLVFGAMLAAVSVLADYVRVSCVSVTTGTLGGAWRDAIAFVRAHPIAVIAVYLLTGACFVLLLMLYGLADRRFGGWRGVALGQAYIVARLGIRLTSMASQLQLFRRLSAVHATSRAPANPGPPAAT